MKPIARWLLVSILLAFVAGGVFDDASQGLEITYLANEGVLLTSGDAQVLIDGLHRPYDPEYAVLPPEQREQIETAQAPYHEIDVILVSHVHRDHFHAEAVGRHLRHNPGATLIASQQVADSLARHFEAYEAVKAQVRRATPGWAEKATLHVGAIEIDVLRLRHTRQNHRWIQNLGHVVTLGGVKVLHLGDAEMAVDNFEAFDLADEAIDVAFIPYWYLLSGEGRSLVRDHIKPKHLIAVHLPPTGAEDTIRRIHSYFPEAVAFTHLLESKSYED